MTAASHSDTRVGFFFTLGAYVTWGLMPLYLKLLDHIPVTEVLAHRVIWSVPVAAMVPVMLGRIRELREALTSPRMLGMALLGATLISINSGTYFWAVSVNRTIEGALGFYINPLFSVLLGAVVLKERLTRAQVLALGLAALAVAIITWDAGGLPWAAILIAAAWGLYALCRRMLPIGPNQGFLLEVLILSPIALAWIGVLVSRGESHFGPTGLADIALLLGIGVVTAVPLIMFANGAKGLRLSTLGIMQFLVPTMVFLVAVLVFREPFSPARAIGFVFIWTAVAIYSWPLIRDLRASRVSEAS
ncbi:MAG: EamA family transporter RarD [Rhodobiaceae bacterium]|nr:EamA family transporter RarD [Rhodobiaceae bacterium]MCC0060291.1 EamA family transporter RarD [Rhodobiaceae bacterium]